MYNYDLVGIAASVVPFIILMCVAVVVGVTQKFIFRKQDKSKATQIDDAIFSVISRRLLISSGVFLSLAGYHVSYTILQRIFRTFHIPATVRLPDVIVIPDLVIPDYLFYTLCGAGAIFLSIMMRRKHKAVEMELERVKVRGKKKRRHETIVANGQP